MDTAGPHASDATASDVERVVLLDADGTPVGAEPKATVHRNVAEGGTPLHLAFSCHVLNPEGQVLVTRRALSKRTWPGVWSNSFCGHPGPDESFEDAIARRARQELGLEIRNLTVVVPEFQYRATDATGVVENEFCPVFVAVTDTDPQPAESEVAEYAWTAPQDLIAAVESAPYAFSPWLGNQVREPALRDALG